MALDTQKVRNLMHQKRINQNDLAGMCGVSEAAISRYLSGNRQPKSETLANMATTLGTTSNDLLGLEPPAKEDEVFRFVARNAAEIPRDIRLKLIQILSSSEPEDERTT